MFYDISLICQCQCRWHPCLHSSTAGSLARFSASSYQPVRLESSSSSPSSSLSPKSSSLPSPSRSLARLASSYQLVRLESIKNWIWATQSNRKRVKEETSMHAVSLVATSQYLQISPQIPSQKNPQKKFPLWILPTSIISLQGTSVYVSTFTLTAIAVCN